MKSPSRSSPRQNKTPHSKIFTAEEMDSLKTTFLDLSNNQPLLSIQKYLKPIQDFQLQTEKPTLSYIFQKIQSCTQDDVSFDQFIEL